MQDIQPGTQTKSSDQSTPTPNTHTPPPPSVPIMMNVPFVNLKQLDSATVPNLRVCRPEKSTLTPLDEFNLKPDDLQLQLQLHGFQIGNGSNEIDPEEEEPEAEQYKLDGKERKAVGGIHLPEKENYFLDVQEQTTKLTGEFVLKNIITSREPIDVCISCSDGKVGAHRCVVVAASPFIGSMLTDHRLGEMATICVPDVSVKIMSILLNLCYTGQMVFPEQMEDDVLAGLQCLMIGELGEFTFGRVIVDQPQPAIQNSENTTPTPASIISAPTVEPRQPTPTPPADITTTTTQRQIVTDLDTSSSLFSPCGYDIKSSSTNSKKGKKKKPIRSNKSKSINFESDSDDDGKLAQRIKEAWDPRNDHNLPALGIAVGEKRYECCVCKNSLTKKYTLTKHLRIHQKTFWSRGTTDDELQKLSRCAGCGQQYKTVNEANQCLSKHGYEVCIVCLGTFSAREIVAHCRSAHGIPSNHGLVNKCRWCDLAFPISDDDGAALKRHSMVHIPWGFKEISPTSASKAKKRFGSNTATANSITKSKSTSRSPGSSNANSLLSYLNRFQKNVDQQQNDEQKKKEEKDTETETVAPTNQNQLPQPAEPEPDIEVESDSSDTESKRRKLDGNGTPLPLQVAKRTGVPVGVGSKTKSDLNLNRKIVLPSMKFQTSYSLSLNPKTGKIKDLNLKDLPQVHVHLEYISQDEINKYLKLFPLPNLNINPPLVIDNEKPRPKLEMATICNVINGSGSGMDKLDSQIQSIPVPKPTPEDANSDKESRNYSIESN